MKLTIFTPTYNRKNLLARVYSSLQKQEIYDYEWLIIDDGSTDGTEEIINSFMNDNFPVRYYRKQNGGKHTAHNLAVKLAYGEFFMCLDSDDWLADDALRLLMSSLEKCSQSEGVIAYKVDEAENLLSDEFPDNLETSTTSELVINRKCTGEFVLVYPTPLLRKNPFPIFSGEKFITESVLYDKLSKQSRMLLLPKVICVCEYQSEGYTNRINEIMKNNPAGYCLYFMNRIDLQPTLKERVVYAGKYHCFRWFAKKQQSYYKGTHSLSVALSVILGCAFWAYYKSIRGF